MQIFKENIKKILVFFIIAILSVFGVQRDVISRRRCSTKSTRR